MRVLFVGERDDGRTPSSQTAEVVRHAGGQTRFDEAWWWSDVRWRRACLAADVIHLIDYDGADSNLWRKLCVAAAVGCGIVRQWVGSDVLWARVRPELAAFARDVAQLGALQVTVSDGLRTKLARIDVAADEIPVPSVRLLPHCGGRSFDSDWPAILTILCYLPTRRRAFYGGHVVDRLIETMPDAKFLILADEGTDYAGRLNVEPLESNIDMEAVYRRTTVLLRPTLHDGMPKMVLEALARGRYVVTSRRLPQCAFARRMSEFSAALDDLSRAKGPNEAGAAYVAARFDRETVSRSLIACLEQARVRASRARAAWTIVRHLGPLRDEPGRLVGSQANADHDAEWESQVLRCACGGELPRSVRREMREWDEQVACC